MAKLRIEPRSVQETLIIPLYGRKLYAEAFPNLYRDESAARICANLDYDFSDLDKRAESTFWTLPPTSTGSHACVQCEPRF